VEGKSGGGTLGEMLDEGLVDALTEGLGDTEGEGLTDAEAEADGDTDADGEGLRETLALGLSDADGDALAEGEREGEPVNAPSTSINPTSVGEALDSVNDAEADDPVAL
jgi:hypothetical protein